MKKIVLSFLGFIFIIKANTQDPVVPSTPEGSALAKSINFPVAYNTGVPNISIPLYEIKAGGITVPVTINYNAGGFKINERATDVGLGWSLSTNLQISRAIEGIDDFKSGIGYYYNNITAHYDNCTQDPNPAHCQDEQNPQILLQKLRNDKDGQPDRFYYNLLGKSGSFYILKHWQAAPEFITIPHTGIKIEFISANVFKITDTDGTVYWFGANDDPNAYQNTFTEFSRDPDAIGSTWQAIAWKCVKIISPSKADTVYFTYRMKGMEDQYGSQESMSVYSNTDPCEMWDEPPVFPNSPSIMVGKNTWDEIKDLFPFYQFATPKYWMHSFGIDNGFHIVWDTYDEWGFPIQEHKNYGGSDGTVVNARSRVYGLLPDKVTFRGGQLVFTGYNSTTAVTINDNGDNEIKTLRFDQNPWNSTCQGANAIATKYLDDIRITKSTTELEKYSFYYNNKFCFDDLKGGDAWGGVNEYTVTRSDIYNGNRLPMNVFVTNMWGNCLNGDYGFGFGEGHKEPSEGGAKLGILQRIVYPTGGYTDFDFSSNFYRNPVGLLKPAGGLRINKIQYFDGTSLYPSAEKIYKYGENEDGAGLIKQLPSTDAWDLGYKYHQTIQYITDWNPNFPSYRNVHKTEQITTYVSSSFRDMTFSGGAPVHYIKVTEYQKDLGQLTGKTVYEYDQNPYSGFNPSYMVEGTNVAIEASTWHMGKLKSETNYKYENSVYDWVRKKTYTYTTYERPDQVRVEKVFLQNIPSGVEDEGYLVSDFYQTAYGLKVGTLLLSEENEQLKEGSNILTKSTYYYYSDPSKHILPGRIRTTTSDGKDVDLTIKYPCDYPNGTAFIDNLKANYMLDLPVEKITTKDMYGGTYIVAGEKLQYRSDNTGLPDKTYAMELREPVSVSSPFPEYKEKLSFDFYDDRANPLMITPYFFYPTSYIWGYLKLYPIAEVRNAYLNEVAYTSFEADGAGGWSGILAANIVNSPNAITGRQYYALTTGNNLTKSGLNPEAVYTVTYWSKNTSSYTVNGTTGTVIRTVTVDGQTWRCYEHRVEDTYPGILTVSGNGSIDELRAYPVNTKMVTYTYDPMIGMSAKCDENNRILHFSYENGRLAFISDENGNIIKKFCYKYSGQPQNCGD